MDKDVLWIGRKKCEGCVDSTFSLKTRTASLSPSFSSSPSLPLVSRQYCKHCIVESQFVLWVLVGERLV